MGAFFTQTAVNGVALWTLLLMCCGVFTAGLMDGIAGGGGIISVPTYILGLSGRPIYYALGTNKFSSAIGTFFSAGRYIKNGLVEWRLFLPAVVFAVAGSACGTRLQYLTPDKVLKYMLLVVLPVVAFVTLRGREWPDEPGEISAKKRTAVVYLAALSVGCYDGYYGPGAGTFFMITFVRLAKLDTRHAAGGVKVVNLASNIGSMVTALANGYVLPGIGAACAAASIAGHYVGSGLAIKNGSKIVRPVVIIVLILLTLKVGSELLFPDFWA